MSYGTYTWQYEELDIMNDPDGDATAIDVGFVLVCTHPGEPESGRMGPPEFYDPGSPPEWEIESIQLIFENSPALDITETQLGELFPNGDDMINNALEAAAENGEVD
jgi:hypothetical protein